MRNICTSSTDNETAIFWLFKKGALIQNSCVRSFAGCADLNLAGLFIFYFYFLSSGCVVSRAASSVTQALTILSGVISPKNDSLQSVISRVYTSRFGNGTARLEPRPRWY